MGLKFISDSILTDIADAIRANTRGYAYIDNTNVYNGWNTSNNIEPIIMANAIRHADFKGYDIHGNRGGMLITHSTNIANKYQGNTRNDFMPFVDSYYLSNNISWAFNNCVNITGDGMCGDSVRYAISAYDNCRNLDGIAYMGNNVNAAYAMFRNCSNLHGDAPIGAIVDNMSQTYFGCSNLDGVTKQYAKYVGGAVVCGAYLTNLAMGFMNCYNLHGDALGFNFDWLQNNSFVPYPNLTDMYRSFYECQNLNGNLYVGPKVSNLIETFYNCSNLKGAPMSSNLATSMYQTYFNCKNLTGAPKVGPNVTNMLNCYYECQNITGAPIINNNVTIATAAYYNCQCLMGSPIIGGKVTTMANTFYNCRNLTGTADIPATATNLVNAFRNCVNLDGIIIRSNPTAAMMAGAFVRDEFNHRLKVILPTRAAFNNAKGASPTGCTMSAAIVEDVNVKLAYTYSNGVIYGYKTYEAKAYCYNEECNLYIFSLA